MNKDIIIPMAGSNPEISKLTGRLFDSKFKVDGNNIILNTDDVEIRELISTKKHSIISENRDDLVNDLCSMIPALPSEIARDLSERHREYNLDRQIYPDYKIFEINDRLTLAHSQTELSGLLLQAVNFMANDHGLKYCTGIVIENEIFRTYTSFYKMMYLAKDYGLEKARQMLEYDSLERMLPHALAPLGYIDILTRFSPFAFTLMLSRYEGVSWHFYDDNLLFFNGRWWLKPYFSENMGFAAGIYDFGEMLGNSFAAIDGKTISAYLDLIVLSINNLFKYFFNPSNFIDEKNEVNFYKAFIALCTIKLIFSDLLIVNTTVDLYLRHGAAFSALDKIANLIMHVTGKKISDETQLFKSIFYNGHKELLAKIYDKVILNKDLKNIFNKMLEKAYNDVLISTKQSTLEEASNIMRNVRNLQHGAALSGKQLNNIIENEIDLPNSLSIFPYLTILGISLAPEIYFSHFKSTV